MQKIEGKIIWTKEELKEYADIAKGANHGRP